MNTCHTSTSEPNKGQVNRQSREIVCYSPPQRLPSVCIWQTTTVARDATMLRLMLMMFLPVSLRAMVLLPPPDRKDFAAEARVMTKVQNLATGLKGHEGLHTRVADAWDLSSLDSLLSSQLVQLNLDPYNDVMDDIGVSASIGEDAAVAAVSESNASDDGVKHKGHVDISDSLGGESAENDELFRLIPGIHVQTRDLGGVNDELNDLSAPSPVTSELPQKINSQNKARGEDAATETSSWAGVNREKDRENENDEDDGDVIIEEFVRLTEEAEDSSEIPDPLHTTTMTEPTLEGQDTALYPSVDDEDQNWRLERSATSVDLDPLSPTTRLPGKRRKRSVAVRRGLRQQSAPLASSSARVGKVGNPAVKANVEVLAVVDNSIYRKFLAKDSNNREAALARMRRYYGIVFAMVNQRFQTIDSPDLSITVTMSGLLIAETREDSLWLEQLVDWSTVKERGRASVNTDKALNSFRAWTKTQLSFLPKFDHAMVFSGYRLTNKEGRVTLGGKAYMASICDIQNGFSISIVADEGDFQCIKIAAHELGHSLGALHDGDPGADACSPQGNYIMAPYSGNSPDKLRNAFRFSPCSISWMYTTLRSEKADCVRDKANVFYSYDLAKAPPGLIISLDQHCQMVYGPKATFCRHDAKVKEVVCGQLWCRHPDMSNACRTNSYLSALPGTRCGDGKSCHLGECLPDAIIRQANNERRDFSGMSTETFDSIPRTLHSSAPTQHQTSERGRGSVATDPLLGNANVIPSLPQPVISGRVGRPIRPEIIQARRRHTPVRTERRRPGKSRRKGRCRGEQADANMVYCRGLVTLNPGACKRRDVRNYCCRTCSTLTASGI